MSALPDREKLISNFNRCLNQEEKYLYIIELGARLPLCPDSLYTLENIIPGCQSQVWITVNLDRNGLVIFKGDSDAALVRGLIAIVFSCYQNMAPHILLEFDVCAWFSSLTLTIHLTPSRSQGLFSIIRFIQKKSLLLKKYGSN
ncbi:cysteine desulfuration protein SufE [Candidatus Erwinia haradaeae]|uniref:Cysteine desulfuration protein SufE n=1 Tax=Candidatus Erwinia haradaeae TaxID=1922217 RepID=A0A451D8M5_9GAMM|nr:cysteine desulfuration protein SufE [Candidatus Erwinia haradaeae]VFP82168.1 Cysteine desulfuration protein SufE [Candidatus Erwinia haradaeae]